MAQNGTPICCSQQIFDVNIVIQWSIMTRRQKPSAPEKRRRGRPPAGPDGKEVRSLPSLTIRLPGGTKRQLEALAVLEGKPLWRLIDGAVLAYVRALPDADRRAVERLADRAASGQESSG
jgi:hypothetical protein